MTRHGTRHNIINLIYPLLIMLALSGCAKCPDSCDDNNICTVNKCSNETDFVCSYEKIPDCCLSDDDCPVNKECAADNHCDYTDEFLSKEAVKTAQGFSIAWQKEDYGSTYDYFIPELKEMRDKEDFVKFVAISQDNSKVRINLIYDKVVLQDKDLAYAYYTFSGDSMFQPKIPAIEMRYAGDAWKLNAFAGYFTEQCAVEGCNDFDSCTENICNNDTGFSCEYEKIDGCFDIEENEMRIINLDGEKHQIYAEMIFDGALTLTIDGFEYYLNEGDTLEDKGLKVLVDKVNYYEYSRSSAVMYISKAG